MQMTWRAESPPLKTKPYKHPPTYVRFSPTQKEGKQSRTSALATSSERAKKFSPAAITHSPLTCPTAPTYLNKALNQRATEFLCTFLREGFINCTKYAPHGSDISLWAETTHHHLEIALVSPCAHLSESETETALSSGLGIASLYEKAQTLDLDVLIGPANGTWFHSVRIPIFHASPEDKDEP